MADATARTDDPPEVRPFAAFLQEQRQGDAHDEMSAIWQEVVQASLATGKVGEITIKLKVKPQGDGVSCLVLDETKGKAPQADRPPAIFFADTNGNLHRTDPRQARLPLREVDPGTGEVREVREASVRG